VASRRSGRDAVRRSPADRLAGMPVASPFVEVADRVWHARYRQWDVGVGLVVGSTGALVADTRASTVQGLEVLADVRRLGLRVEVVAVVNTHVHFDHTFGNGAFADARIHAHRRVGETFMADAERLKDLVRSEGDKDAPELGYTAVDLQDVLATPPRGPDVTFATTSRVDLGDRVVELAHAGRGHTDGDIRIVVPDAGVVFLGDLVEESAPPSLGGDSWPLDWAPTLDAHLTAVGPDTVVVPGHGRPADRNFVTQQRDELAAIATVVRERHAAGIPLPDAQQEADDRLPYPLDHLGDAFARGYARLSGELDGEPA
jgi:glyoxylase-like metal-dependent hydrolase (beta-lactamase superfamily II)